MRNHNKYAIRFPAVLAVIIALLSGGRASYAKDLIRVTDDSLKEIASILPKERSGLTSFIIRRNEKIKILKSGLMDAPPRILYDIIYDGGSFPSVVRTVETGGIKSIRVGHHPGVMRVVIDLDETVSPRFAHLLKEKELVINIETGMENRAGKTVSSEKIIDAAGNKHKVPEPFPPEERKEEIVKNEYPDNLVMELQQKGELLLTQGKNMKALSVFEEIIKNHNSPQVIAKAEIGRARALFQMNSFENSIAVLSRLAGDPGVLSGHPDVLLYLGYNYLQTQNYSRAKEYLFGYYNISPEGKENHLIMSRIGDIYKAEGANEAAAKIYRLVLSLHPQTEGAIISLTRLAELQENTAINNVNNVSVRPDAATDGTSSPRMIYESIIDNSLHSGGNSQMAEFAKLKLAIINRKEKNYAESLSILQALLKNFPRSKLQADIIYALGDTFGAIVEDEGGKELYSDVVGVFEKEKKRIEQYAQPEIYIAVARACLNIGLDDTAAELFSRAESIPLAGDKPLKITADILHFKGRMLMKKKEYPQAIEMFSQALKNGPGQEERILVTADMAYALAAAGRQNESSAAAREVDKLVTDKPGTGQPVLKKIGDVYLSIGKTDEALSVFRRALASEKNENEKIRLKFAIAGCLRILDKKDEYIDLYRELAKADDPLWSRVAVEKMESEIFDEMMGKRNSRKKRR
jgi:tetratricopeptide (TPR) repeat protein